MTSILDQVKKWLQLSVRMACSLSSCGQPDICQLILSRSEIKTFCRYQCRGSNNAFITRGITNDNVQERQRAKLNEVNWQINAHGELNSSIQITALLFRRLRTRRKQHVCLVSWHRPKISTAIQSGYLFWPNILQALMHSFLNTGKTHWISFGAWGL